MENTLAEIIKAINDEIEVVKTELENAKTAGDCATILCYNDILTSLNNNLADLRREENLLVEIRYIWY